MTKMLLNVTAVTLATPQLPPTLQQFFHPFSSVFVFIFEKIWDFVVAYLLTTPLLSFPGSLLEQIKRRT